MLGRSFFPQYWLIRMPTPDWTPNTMEISRNTGTLAAVTAYIVESVGKVLDSAPISYVKWDMNLSLIHI